MQNVIGFLLCFPLIALLLMAFFKNEFLNRKVRGIRKSLTHLAALNAIVALTGLVYTQISGPFHWTLGPEWVVSLSFYFDGVSTLMLTLVASVGWVICRYSMRYLDGEDKQGQYFKWTAFTIGAVSLVVVTGNLIVMVTALLFTSIGLHQLLVHYSDRPAAKRAAAIKFFFSRVGDLALIVAAVALYQAFGTFQLVEIFAEIVESSAASSSAAVTVAGWAVVLAAVLKSAQFPFHTWLPETMEAPTPVSALMHAGIVNAGGYLLIRTAPIVLLTPAALWAVAAVGALTTLIAALVMLSQTSVKRKLAWSTIAQMGFMILQCGLGAFSAAMLHIVAHSLYKAHAFLSSGSVLREQAAADTQVDSQSGLVKQFAAFSVAIAVTVGLYLGLGVMFGISPETKPGGMVLGFVLCLGIAAWTKKLLLTNFSFALPAITISAGLITAYFASYTVVDAVIAESLVNSLPLITSTGFAVAATIGFALLYAIETFVGASKQSSWLNGLYVHSSNGFYIDVFWRNASKSLSA